MSARRRLEALLVAERCRAIDVVALVKAELPVSHLLVERDGGGVVVSHLEAHDASVMGAGVALAGLQQRPTDAAPRLGRVDRERIDSRAAAALAQRDQRVSGDRLAEPGDEQGMMRRAKEVAQRAPRQPVAGEGGAF